MLIGNNGEEKGSGHEVSSGVLDSHDQACQRPIGHSVPRDKLAALLEAVFSNKNTANALDCLQEEHAQTLIDVIDTVWCWALQPPEVVLAVCFDFLLSFG